MISEKVLAVISTFQSRLSKYSNFCSVTGVTLGVFLPYWFVYSAIKWKVIAVKMSVFDRFTFLHAVDTDFNKNVLKT